MVMYNGTPMLKYESDDYVGFRFSINDYHLALAELSRMPDKNPYAYYISVKRLFEQWFDFNRLSVPKEIRNQGIATALMVEVAKWADEKEVNIICTVNPYGDLDMAALIKFYEKYGFIDVGEVPGLMIRYFK